MADYQTHTSPSDPTADAERRSNYVSPNSSLGVSDEVAEQALVDSEIADRIEAEDDRIAAVKARDTFSNGDILLALNTVTVPDWDEDTDYAAADYAYYAGVYVCIADVTGASGEDDPSLDDVRWLAVGDVTLLVSATLDGVGG